MRGTGARPELPVRGVRGEIFWLHAPGVRLRRPLRLMHPRHRVYLVPREGDIVVVGASEIESEDRSPVSLRSTVELLAAAHSVVPELAEARVVHSEANLRPALPDNLPHVETQPGLTRINGLFRHGWLIAPALVEDALAAVMPASAAGPGRAMQRPHATMTAAGIDRVHARRPAAGTCPHGSTLARRWSPSLGHAPQAVADRPPADLIAARRAAAIPGDGGQRRVRRARCPADRELNDGDAVFTFQPITGG